MNLKECFAAFQGDYDGVIGRLMSEERVKKFLQMFVRDPSFDELCSAMENGEYDKAFMAAHTLKGIAANLGIVKLQHYASDMTEALRGNVNNGADAYLPFVIREYQITTDAIHMLE